MKAADLYTLIASTPIGMEELRTLTWGQVDLNRGTLALPSGVVPLPPQAAAALGTPGVPEAYVLSTASGKPYDAARLSKTLKAALEEAGYTDMTFQAFRRLTAKGAAESLVRRLASRSLGVTAAEIRRAIFEDHAAPLGASQRRAGKGAEDALEPRRRTRALLETMVRSGELVVDGKRYYRPAAWEAAQAREEAVVAFLAREGLSYRQDIARALRLTIPETAAVLEKLVRRGRIALEGQRYHVDFADSER